MTRHIPAFLRSAPRLEFLGFGLLILAGIGG